MQRGFTLVEILVVLIILAVVITMAAAVTRGIAASQQQTLTVTRLATVDAAIVQFVAAQKRMPCPADGTLQSSDNNAGLEAAGCNQTNGVVPWRSLGLTEQDATDGWYRRFTFRTDPQLVVAGGMDMSFCDPVGGAVAVAGACNTGCASSSLGSCTPPVNFLRGKGLEVHALPSAGAPNGVVVMDPAASPSIANPTGAAYVTISAGATGGGGYLNSGQLAVSSASDSAPELLNYASNSIQLSSAGAYYVDDSISTNPHFDDLISRPSVYTVISKAALGPRSH
ncbi:MAG TPA: type II secretion system protein [Usitatibacter sp.]|nr:type II secretion system protein [Usitatibacter sp.]